MRRPRDDAVAAPVADVPRTGATDVEVLVEEPDLGRRAAAGGIATIGAQVARAVIQAVGVVVLARLLTPVDFGRMAIVIALVGLGELFRDFGLGNSAMSAPSLSRAQRDNLVWINTGLGCVVAVVLFAAAGPVAAVFDDPALEGIARALSLVFVLNGLATQYRASLSRGLRVVPLAAADLVAFAVALVVGIAMAAAGLGYWALVAMELVRAGIGCAGAMLLSGWLPRRYARVPMRGFLTFGWNVFVAQLVGYVSANVDTLVLGIRAGASVVGIYSRAFQLMALPIRQFIYPVTRVALPVLARLRDDRARFERFLVQGQASLLHLFAFLVAGVAAFAEPLVDVALGPGWSAVVTPLRLLCIGGMFTAANFTAPWVFQALDRTRALLWMSVVTKSIVVVAILVGSVWGMNGVALGCSLGTAVTWPIGLLWVSRTTGVRVRPLFRNASLLIVGYAVCAAVASLVVSRAGITGPLAQLAAGGAAYVAAVGALMALPAWRRSVLAMLRTARSSVRRRSAPVAPVPPSAPDGQPG